ncbi:MAG: hypothetical protein II973_13140 [Spirochaetaceae bacterium]|nr:hypothetical protein [Spirochaetaceae bacterium]
MKRIFIAIAFLAFFAFQLAAQAVTSVTDISVLVTNMSVQITWKRGQGYSYSPDTNYRIYRDTKPLTKQTVNASTLIAEQDSSQLIFSEILPDTAHYYYAVMAVKDDSFLTSAVVPGMNATQVAVTGQYSDWEITEKANISNFNVIAQNSAVIITYTTENRGNRLNLYRSIYPFTNLESLANALLLASFTDTGAPLTDVPPQNQAFYYALAEESAVSDGTARFIRGVTTSIAPVSIRRSNTNLNTTAQTSRIAPLPLDSYGSATDESETSQLLSGYGTDSDAISLSSKNFREMYIFPSETADYPGGATELSSIVLACFNTKNWLKAESELSKYIAGTNSNSAKQRAEFYLAEAYYFLGKKRQSLLLFLSLRDQYPLESAEWIDAVIALK